MLVRESKYLVEKLRLQTLWHVRHPAHFLSRVLTVASVLKLLDYLFFVMKVAEREVLTVPYLKSPCRSFWFGGSGASTSAHIFWPFKQQSIHLCHFVCHFGADWQVFCKLIEHLLCRPYFLKEQKWKRNDVLGQACCRLPICLRVWNWEVWKKVENVSEFLSLWITNFDACLEMSRSQYRSKLFSSWSQH